MVMRIDSPAPARHSISLTPLIDVVFILLIFFMLASSFAKWQGVELSVGQSQEVPQDQPELMIIQITANSGWQHQGLLISAEDMLQRLSQAREEAKALSIMLQPMNGSQVQSLVDALGLLREQGFSKVGLVREAS
jgi:biopolymer transport protein ExbD